MHLSAVVLAELYLLWGRGFGPAQIRSVWASGASALVGGRWMRWSRALRNGALLCRTLLLYALFVLALPANAKAQDYAFIRPRSAVGVGLYYRYGYLAVEAPKSSADVATKGLVDVLPGRIPQQGPTLGISFGDFGVVAAYTFFAADINKKADTNGDGVGDTNVLAIQGDSVSMSLLYQPVKHVFIGYGTYRGTLRFQLVNAGVGSTRKIAIGGRFYNLGLAWGVDPKVRRSQLFFSIYATPTAGSGSEVSTYTYGIGLGAFF